MANVVANLPIERIHPDPGQPRKRFESAALHELAESIKTHGLLQPISVRRVDGHHVIVAGERRWRACKLAGLAEIPALIVDVTEDAARELSIIENLHRKDINVVEESDAYAELLRRMEENEERLIRAVGKPTGYVRDRLRLQGLCGPMREALVHGVITLPQGLHLAKLSTNAQMLAFEKMDGMNSKVFGRMCEALAEQESQADMFAATEKKSRAQREEERAALSRYDRFLEQIEGLLRRSFSVEDLSVLAEALDGDTGARAERITLIMRDLGKLVDALRRANGRQASLGLLEA